MKSSKPKTHTIKSSRHFISEANKGKIERYDILLKESLRVLNVFISHIWNNGFEFSTKAGVKKICNPANGYYDIPPFYDYNKVPVDTFLSGRMKSSLITQACGIVKSAVELQKKRIYILNKLEDKAEKTVEDEKSILKLRAKIKKKAPKMPIINNVAIELSSKNAVLIETGKEFDFLKLKSLGIKDIYVPIRHHRHSRNLEKKGKRMNSFLIGKNYINLRWDIELPPLKKTGKILGCDTGKNTIITLSNDKSTDLHLHPHGHTLDSIMRSMARKKKGSKSFLKAQSLRTNFINWSVRKLNLDGVKQINLEEVKNIFYKNKTSRFMSAWTNSEIVSAFTNLCDELGVQVHLQSSVYRSQRCSHCGLVRKSNRKGKVYKCNGCGLIVDADKNGARNHAIELLPIPTALRRLKLNREGFYWNPTGFFNLDGSALRVPHSSKELSKS